MAWLTPIAGWQLVVGATSGSPTQAAICMAAADTAGSRHAAVAAAAASATGTVLGCLLEVNCWRWLPGVGVHGRATAAAAAWPCTNNLMIWQLLALLPLQGRQQLLLCLDLLVQLLLLLLQLLEGFAGATTELCLALLQLLQGFG